MGTSKHVYDFWSKNLELVWYTVLFSNYFHFCKTEFVVSVWYTGFSFVLENNFFFRGSHALFQNSHKLFSLFVFYPILLFTHKINIIIFFNILHITLCMCVCVCCVCMCVCVYVCCLMYFTHGSYLVAVEIYLLFKAHPPHMLLLVRCF